MAIKIKPYTEALGAEILNINLGRKLSDKNVSLVKNALNKYHVLFFREQDISSKQFISFGKNFGSLEIHPLIPTLPGHPEIIELKSCMSLVKSLIGMLRSMWIGQDHLSQ